MIEFSASEIASLTGGALVGPGSGSPVPSAVTVTSATTDSRECVPGSLFVARPGEESDGHLFVGAAFERGAVLALAEREVAGPDGAPYPAVVVPDAVLAMGQLAAEIVRRLRAHGDVTVIGITGSAGKTTTKDLLAGILSRHGGPTVAPRGSYNGEVGVPLTVFEADWDTRYLVIEMGATKPGHIAYLASLVQPDVGVVLGVGSAHAGEFGGVENIARAKGELFEALGPDGTAVINADDERVYAMRSRTSARIVHFTSSDDFASDAPVLRARNSTTTSEGNPSFTLLFPDGSEHDVVSPLLGLHHTTNLLAAAAVADLLGCTPEQIAGSLRELAAASRWRMERTDRADGVTVINDAYNANPESMRAALRTLAELGRDRRRTWAVLGEMLELGDRSIEEHDLLGRVVVRLNISKLVCVGPNTRALFNGAVLEGSWGSEAVHVTDIAAAEALLAAELEPGDLVLFKSSNGAGLRYLGDRVAAGTVSDAPTDTSSDDSVGDPTDDASPTVGSDLNGEAQQK
jgi:UDP-N-acetylmuramoyl-tripeptide--D-alanyl-D-alanine ligase